MLGKSQWACLSCESDQMGDFPNHPKAVHDLHPGSFLKFRFHISRLKYLRNLVTEFYRGDDCSSSTDDHLVMDLKRAIPK